MELVAKSTTYPSGTTIKASKWQPNEKVLTAIMNYFLNYSANKKKQPGVNHYFTMGMHVNCDKNMFFFSKNLLKHNNRYG